MIKETEDFLNKYNIQNKTVIAAFSAGPDSCCLALILNKLKEKYNLNIILAYFNHGWRKEANDEEEFTKNFAQKLNLKYIIQKAPKEAEKTEEKARELRYIFLENAAKENNSDVVFLAHNKNDNVETIIYRIIKGTSIKGTRAIQEKREIYFRPLLNIEKKEILKYLKENNQKYMIDNSNEETKYKRNYIRKEILPLFEKINPNYLNSINNFAKMCILAQDIIDDKINEIKGCLIKNNIINKKIYTSLKEPYRLEILNDFLGEKLKYRDYKTIKKLDNFILNNITSKTSLNKFEFLKVKKDKIFIENSIKGEDNE